jgi:hypothetical protein
MAIASSSIGPPTASPARNSTVGDGRAPRDGRHDIGPAIAIQRGITKPKHVAKRTVAADAAHVRIRDCTLPQRPHLPPAGRVCRRQVCWYLS